MRRVKSKGLASRKAQVGIPAAAKATLRVAMPAQSSMRSTFELRHFAPSSPFPGCAASRCTELGAPGDPFGGGCGIDAPPGNVHGAMCFTDRSFPSPDGILGFVMDAVSGDIVDGVIGVSRCRAGSRPASRCTCCDAMAAARASSRARCACGRCRRGHRAGHRGTRGHSTLEVWGVLDRGAPRWALVDLVRHLK